MKFGKQLEQQSLDKWRPFYVNYKQLKKMLKDGQKEPGQKFNSRNRVDKVSHMFDLMLTSEMRKCNSFFVEKVEEIDTLLVSEAHSKPNSQLHIISILTVLISFSLQSLRTVKQNVSAKDTRLKSPKLTWSFAT